MRVKCIISDYTLNFFSFKLQAVIAGRQGDLQRSQKLTKNANTCLVVGFILFLVPYFTVAFGVVAVLVWVSFVIIRCCIQIFAP